MDFRRLEIFRAVAKRGNLRQAASQLGISLPAISVQLKKLEEELGVALFHHLPNKLVLTEQGRALHRHLDVVFDALDRAKSEISSQPDACRGNVSISLGTDLSRYFAPHIARFVNENPAVNFSLQSRSSSKGMALLLDREIDMSIGFYKSVPRSIQRIPLLQTGISLIFPRGTNIDTDAGQIFDIMSDHRMIMLPRTATARRMIDSALDEHGVAMPSSIEVGGCQAIMQFVRLRLGLGLVHTICACAEPHDDLDRIDVSEHFGKLDVALAVRSETLLSSSHQALIGALSNNPDAAHHTHA